MTDRITIRKPHDWHLHVRDGAMLKAALPFTARHFGRAIIMPNLLPPVCTVREAQDYRGRIVKALPPGSNFEPLMTCYMTHDTKPDEVESGFKAGEIEEHTSELQSPYDLVCRLLLEKKKKKEQ